MKNTIQSIYIYPIKSLGGINLSSALAQPAGLQYDRRWMLVDEQNDFMTQRNYAEMCLFHQSINKHFLSIQFKAHQIDIPLAYEEKELETCQIWEDKTEAYEVDAQVSEWFSTHLKKSCRLMRINKNHKRIHTEKGNLKMSLADGYPYLFIGTASLEYLNNKLDEAVPMNRFRPNVVVKTDKQHEEDTWKDFSIANTDFKGSHPCGRCRVVSINQQTANIGKEPLKTLSTYRREGQRVNFGMNVFCEHEGIIKVGETLKFDS